MAVIRWVWDRIVRLFWRVYGVFFERGRWRQDEEETAPVGDRAGLQVLVDEQREEATAAPAVADEEREKAPAPAQAQDGETEALEQRVQIRDAPPSETCGEASEDGAAPVAPLESDELERTVTPEPLDTDREQQQSSTPWSTVGTPGSVAQQRTPSRPFATPTAFRADTPGAGTPSSTAVSPGSVQADLPSATKSQADAAPVDSPCAPAPARAEPQTLDFAGLATPDSVRQRMSPSSLLGTPGGMVGEELLDEPDEDAEEELLDEAAAAVASDSESLCASKASPALAPTPTPAPAPARPEDPSTPVAQPQEAAAAETPCTPAAGDTLVDDDTRSPDAATPAARGQPLASLPEDGGPAQAAATSATATATPMVQGVRLVNGITPNDPRYRRRHDPNAPIVVQDRTFSSRLNSAMRRDAIRKQYRNKRAVQQLRLDEESPAGKENAQAGAAAANSGDDHSHRDGAQ